MDSTDFKELERLMSKLSGVLKYRFCIIPEHIQDLAYVATYDHSGNMIGQANGLDIEDAVKKLLSSPTQNTDK